MIYVLAIYFLSALIVGVHIVRSTIKNPFTYIGSSFVRSFIGMLFCTLCPIFNTFIALEVMWLSFKNKRSKKVKGTPMTFPPPTISVINRDVDSLYPHSHFSKENIDNS